MASVKRIFRQQSARVASSSANSHQSTGSTTSTNDGDLDEEEEKFVISSTDDTALILSRRQRPPRRAPLHSNSFVCLFSDRVALARGLSHHLQQKPTETAVDQANIKRQGVIFRSGSPSGRLRCVTAPSRPLVVAKASRTYSRTPTFDNLAHLGRSVDGYRLTVHQRTLIQQCWHAATRKSKLSESAGCFVFRWIFKREPRMKVIFGLKNVPDDRLLNDSEFQKHAQAFTDVLELVVDSVGAEQDSAYLLDDTMGPFLCSYGAEFAQMEKQNSTRDEQTQFQVPDWELFATGIREYVMCGTWTPLGPFQKKNEALHAWHVLAHFIVTKVRRGYEHEKERLHPAHKRSTGSSTGAFQGIPP